MCLAEELSVILQCSHIDINLKIALILGRQHGWPIDYIYNHWNTKFVLVVSVTPVADMAPAVVSKLAIPTQEDLLAKRKPLVPKRTLLKRPEPKKVEPPKKEKKALVPKFDMEKEKVAEKGSEPTSKPETPPKVEEK